MSSSIGPFQSGRKLVSSLSLFLTFLKPFLIPLSSPSIIFLPELSSISPALPNTAFIFLGMSLNHPISSLILPPTLEKEDLTKPQNSPRALRPILTKWYITRWAPTHCSISQRSEEHTSELQSREK